MLKPLPRQTGDLLKRAGFLEEVGRPGDDVESLFYLQLRQGLLIQFDDRAVLDAHQQQSGRAHLDKGRARQIRSSSP